MNKVFGSDQDFSTKQATNCTNLSDDNIISTIREITQTIFTTYLCQFISTDSYFIYFVHYVI